MKDLYESTVTYLSTSARVQTLSWWPNVLNKFNAYEFSPYYFYYYMKLDSLFNRFFPPLLPIKININIYMTLVGTHSYPFSILNAGDSISFHLYFNSVFFLVSGLGTLCVYIYTCATIWNSNHIVSDFNSQPNKKVSSCVCVFMPVCWDFFL